MLSAAPNELRKLRVVPMEGLRRKRALRRRGGHGHRAANGRPWKAGVEMTGCRSGRGCGGLNCRREEQARSGERATRGGGSRGTGSHARRGNRGTGGGYYWNGRTPHPPTRNKKREVELGFMIWAGL
jgi:hypothetical protein